MSSLQTTDIQKKITDGQFGAALHDIESLLSENGPDDPQHSEALYMAAVCYRYTTQYEKAQGCLDTLKTLAADRGRVYQEQGHLHIARNRLEPALAAFTNACHLNPALVASWRAQEGLLKALGRPGEAGHARAQYQRLEALPKALVAVTDLLAQGRLLKAETLCRQFLKANPTHVEGMRLLADIAFQFGVLDDADYLLESAAEFAPQNTQVKIDRINVLRRQQKVEQALALARSLHEQQPGDVRFQSLYAIEKVQMGDYDGAIELFDRVLAKLPRDAATLTSKGHALKTCGKQKEAIASYRAAVKHNPRHGDAWYSLSNLKTYRFSAPDIERMQTLERQGELSPASRVHIAFALGKALEDEESYAESFEHYQRGNRLKRQQRQLRRRQDGGGASGPAALLHQGGSRKPRRGRPCRARPDIHRRAAPRGLYPAGADTVIPQPG